MENAKVEEKAEVKVAEKAEVKVAEKAEVKVEEKISPEAEKKILKQVEFYFSNSNLPNDSFLQEKMTENEGWVPIEVLLTFNRLKSLTTDLQVLVAALRKSQSLLTVSEDGTKVKRAVPVPADYDAVKYSIYAKGLPEDSTIDTIEQFFRPYGQVACVRMRMKRAGKKKSTFKGSVFVEFSSVEEAQKIAALELKQPNNPEENILMMMKADYVAMKAKEFAAKKGGNSEGKETEAKAEEAETKVEAKSHPKDRIVAFAGMGEGGSREAIKDVLTNVKCQVAFVDYSRGQPDGYARLQEEDTVGATEACKQLNEAKTTIASSEITFRALEGEEETQYWVELRTKQGQKGQKRRGGRGGRGGGKRQRR